MRKPNGQYDKGQNGKHKYPIGTIRVRTRRKRNDTRAFIKIEEPNTWILYAHFVWEEAHGAIPVGMSVHHEDGNRLNDAIENLLLVSKADHLAIHRPEFKDKAIASFVEARRTQKWSTKSDTKRTGRHPRNCTCPIHSG